jgi:hypothetical protein
LTDRAVVARSTDSPFNNPSNKLLTNPQAATAFVEDEMAKTQGLLEDRDWGNNSVWCYRHGLLRRRLDLGPLPSEKTMEPLEAWAYRLWYVNIY